MCCVFHHSVLCVTVQYVLVWCLLLYIVLCVTVQYWLDCGMCARSQSEACGPRRQRGGSGGRGSAGGGHPGISTAEVTHTHMHIHMQRHGHTKR